MWRAKLSLLLALSASTCNAQQRPDSAESNLWPQLAPEFHYKDHLENYLKVQVCTERMSLADAQREIMTNWVASYEQHIGKLPFTFGKGNLCQRLGGDGICD